MISRQLLIILTYLFFGCEEQGEFKSDSENEVEVKEEKTNYKPTCEWCGANEAPENISWKTTIASENEPGERMIISGTVYQKDGKTPAPDVIIYVYHTNSEGKYPKKGDETGNGKRHGYLRGWMKTNEKGHYEFESIKPAAYKSHGGEPAHVHYVIKAPGKSEYWIDALVFEGDPRTTKEIKENTKRDGGFGIVTQLDQNENGLLLGSRNIILEDY